nr:MAG TPA_asm: hypothetical protein [Bacteriophage sp.]
MFYLYKSLFLSTTCIFLEVFTTSVNRQKESIPHKQLCEILSFSETRRSFIYYFFCRRSRIIFPK